MVVSLFSFAGIAVAAREVGRSLAPLDVMLYRSWLGLLILAAIHFSAGGSIAGLRTTQIRLLASRSVIQFAAQYSWLVAVTLIPLAQLFAIEFTAPLWTALLAPLFLKERLTGVRLISALLGFAGVVIVVSPGTIAIDRGTIYALVAAVGFACHFIMTKHLTRREGAFLLLFHMHLAMGCIALVFSISSLKIPDLVASLWVVAVTLLGLSAHYGLTRAFALADAIVVAPMDFLRLPLIAVVGLWLYDEKLAPALIAGAAIIVVANLLNIWGERRRRGQG